ncbi:retrovirus-related pol polyprotein from transposon TNT 1-94 [Tanacetum coccineum]
MSTSNTHQQSLVDAGSETRPPMLERGSYIPWASHFRRYLNRKRENRKWLNKAINEGPYEFKIFTPSDTKALRMQKEEDLKGDDLKHYEAEIEAMNLILISIPNYIYNSVDACKTEKAMWQRLEREALVSVYNRFAQLMNDLERNDIIFPNVNVNTKFLNCLQPEWLKAKKLEKPHDPLALVAHTNSSSRITTPYYVTHPSSVVDYDDDYQGDVVQNNSEDPLTSAMILLARAITQRFSNPTNNRLHTSSNSRIQAIIQGGRVNIQIRNYGNDGRNTRRSMFKRESLRVTMFRMMLETYSELFKLRPQELLQMFNATTAVRKDEAGVILTDEQNDFLFVDASRMEEIEELSANICLMARIQPANIDSDAGPSYDSIFFSEYPKQPKIINIAIGNDQIDNNIIFDEPNDDVNSSSVDDDNNAQQLYELEQLVRNAYKEAEKQQRFAKKVQQQNIVLTKELELYKEKNPKLYDASCLDNSKILMNVRDTEDILDDATKSQIKMKNKMKDPIVIEKKQNVSTIDYKKLNALYEDFVPQKELSAKQKYFSSSFISSKNSSNASSPYSSSETKPTVTPMPRRKALDDDDGDMLMFISSLDSRKKALDEMMGHANVFIYLVSSSSRRNSVLSNTKNSSEKVEVSDRSNNKPDVASKNVALDKRLRALFTTPRTVKSKFEDTTPVVSKTRFLVKIIQSNPLDIKNAAVNPLSAKNKVVQIVLWIIDSGCSKHMTGLGHNLFSVGQFCDGDLEVAFRSKTCYVRNLEGDDLLTRDRESNLYTISDMAASSPVCLMSKATSTKSWLWHRTLSHLNFGTINDLTKHDLVDGLLKFKYGKDHLCSACERGKRKKASHPSKLVPSTHSKLELLHMDLCGPMRVASINGKKYILVIVDDYSRYTWVYFLHSKDETLEIIKKFIAQVQLNYDAKIHKIRTDNDIEFKNATLKAHYEKLGIMQQFSTAQTPQQNGVVERRNRTLVEVVRTMLIFSRLPEFLWAEAVSNACFSQNQSIIHTRHNKTPYELLHGRKPNVEYFHVFGSLCYPTNDRDDLGKIKPKADIGIFIRYSKTLRGFRIYNWRTKKIMETIHVKFDELTVMASEHDSLEPASQCFINDDSSAESMNTPSVR